MYNIIEKDRRKPDRMEDAGAPSSCRPNRKSVVQYLVSSYLRYNTVKVCHRYLVKFCSVHTVLP
jgi:hypothetical protein